MKIKRLPAGFVIPAQPVMALRPPFSADWVHEIKHDGYRLIVRRDGPTVRLYTRNAYDWTPRLPAIAVAAERIEAKSFTIDGEAVAFANMADYLTVGPDGDPRLDWSKLTRDQAAALTEVTVDEFKSGRGEDARDVRRVRFKLADKRQALVDIGKCLGLFKDKVELTGRSGGPIYMENKDYSTIEAVRLIGRLLTKTAALAAPHLDPPRQQEGQQGPSAPTCP